MDGSVTYGSPRVTMIPSHVRPTLCHYTPQESEAALLSGGDADAEQPFAVTDLPEKQKKAKVGGYPAQRS